MLAREQVGGFYFFETTPVFVLAKQLYRMLNGNGAVASIVRGGTQVGVSRYNEPISAKPSNISR